MADTKWAIRDGAIVEQPRDVRKHPLLSRIYRRHDQLIGEYLPAGRTLELAFGRHLHPRADVGVEAWPANAAAVETPAVAGDARALPFDADSFDAVIGRRFLHHVSAPHRESIVREIARVLRPGGRVVVLEGTPGLYRTLTKGLAFKLGLLDEDTDVYGHLSATDVRALLDAAFDLRTVRSLGSPLMVGSISESPLSAYLFPLYRRTNVVRWWTLAVGEVPG
jgi:SAM-dependent methyltransferase